MKTALRRTLSVLSFLTACMFALGTTASGDSDSVVRHLPPAPTISANTVPTNGDVNPYGVFFVPNDFPSGGVLHPGDVVVSNFNNSKNLQGTGTTIVSISSTGTNTLFFTSKTSGVVGLSTALGVLKAGFVLVGNVPSTDGSGMCTQSGALEENVGQGSLLILDLTGHVVETLADSKLLDGPWDLAIDDHGDHASIFVSNVLSGTVTRVDLTIPSGGNPEVAAKTQIASGYLHRCDPSAFVVGPTGLALNRETDTLYIASTGDNEIFSVSKAESRTADEGMGTLFIQDHAHLHGPLGLALSPDGDLISAQGDAVNPKTNRPSEIVEYTPQGHFAGEFSIDPSPGSAFGLAIVPSGDGFRFAAVDDGTNVLDIWDVQ